VSPAGRSRPAVIGWPGWYALVILALVYAFNIADRFVVSALIEPIKHELELSDTSIGFLTGTALAIFYTGMGVPLGLIADRVDRRKLIALSLGIWSLMTAFSGLAANFLQLLLARIGVGIGEAGGTPASQSYLSNVFPRSHLVLANTVFTLGAAAGSMLGSVAGGNIADALGWRAAFLALGIPGVGLALIVRFTLREPSRGAESPAAGGTPLGETLRFIRGQRSLLHTLVGATVVTYWGWGLLWWTPAFFSRTHHLSTGQAGTLVGSVSGIAGAAGVIGGGLIIHFLARRDLRWQVWVVAAATLLGTLASVAVFAADRLSTATVALWLFVPVAYLNLGPILALTQSLVKPRMRGLTCAVLLFGANVANLALAPQFIGILSDLLAREAGVGTESLRWALLINTVTGLWAAYHFWAAGRGISTDLARAEAPSDALPGRAR
jgi:predicted MFS family arabinose efflux permease